jgi:dethiobiotin synthetase
MSFACFVAGTDTEIGKTLVASAIVHALVKAGARAVGMKPVAAGAELRDGAWHNEDVDALRHAGNVDLPPELGCQYLLKTPCAPEIAARLDGAVIEPQRILDAYREVAEGVDAVVVEGVGGFIVPLTATFDTAMLAQQLALPVILVVGMRLGCQSHALLTVEAIRARGLHLAGWVANMVDPAMSWPEENLAALAARIPAPLLGRVPRLAEPSALHASHYLDLSGLPGWPQTD